jgi:NAD(P)-dependent dehydrogenase (short-subunit alcohol dehydrogenase family)
MDISLGLEGTHVLITGGGGLIGGAVIEAFIAASAKVTSLDISHGPSSPDSDVKNPLLYHADITDEESLFRAFELAYLKNGPVQVCVALAALDLSALPHSSATDMSLEQFRRTMDVNVVGTFATARQWLRGLRFWKEEHGLEPLLTNVSLIIVGSESGHW